AVLQKLRDSSERASSQGHSYKLRQYYKPTDCAVCHEPLWGKTNQGYECSVCKMICHKACKTLNELTCEESRVLKTVAPLYFMAQDVQDRARWLQGVERCRREAHNDDPKTPLSPRQAISNGSIFLPEKRPLLPPE
ncbi:uncharacterized protein EV422DRAFT_492359, partial [Fimicolochytrium jonesii]|uniref:uncharacterized protein n=1 Tax=Fimicolochytrium jonesii TaxID=1396493 RepID=UPI0022FDBC1B